MQYSQSFLMVLLKKKQVQSLIKKKYIKNKNFFLFFFSKFKFLNLFSYFFFKQFFLNIQVFSFFFFFFFHTKSLNFFSKILPIQRYLIICLLASKFSYGSFFNFLSKTSKYFYSKQRLLANIKYSRRSLEHDYYSKYVKFPTFFLYLRFLKLFFFRDMFFNINFIKKQPLKFHGNIVTYLKDLSVFPKKPYFIRNYTGISDKMFWRYLKKNYKRPRVYIVKKPKFTKKTLRFKIIFMYLRTFFSKTHMDSFLKRCSDLKRLLYLRRGFHLLFFTKRLYQLKRFCTLKEKKNIFNAMFFKVIFSLKLFLSFYFNISLKNAVVLIRMGIIFVNGICVKNPNWQLRKQDHVFLNCSLENLIYFPLKDNLKFFILSLKSYSFSKFKQKLVKNISSKSIVHENNFIFKFLLFKYFLTQNISINQNVISFFSGNLVGISPEKRYNFFNRLSAFNSLNSMEGFSSEEFPYTLNIFYKIYKTRYQVKTFGITISLLKYLEQRFNSNK